MDEAVSEQFQADGKDPEFGVFGADQSIGVDDLLVQVDEVLLIAGDAVEPVGNEIGRRSCWLAMAASWPTMSVLRSAISSS